MTIRQIRNSNDLNKMMMEYCKELCTLMTEEVYSAINYFIIQYYNEWTPSQYQRTEAFLQSAFKTDVKKIGNGYQAIVGIDYESLNEYEEATGFQTVTWANEGLHGSLDVGTDTHVWDDAMESTIGSGQLLKDCIIYLRSKGFKIVG